MNVLTQIYIKVGDFMAAYTLEFAKERLALWLEAEAAVATGQGYQIGSRRLDRANLYQIREEIKMWTAKVNELESVAGGGGRSRAYRITPRDL